MALLAAALAATPGAAVAADSEPTPGRAPEGASAVLDGLKTYGQAVLRTNDGAVRQVPAGLHEMRVDGGGMLQTYGVGVAGYAQPEARYTESGWTDSPLEGKDGAGRIRWVLEHSYPQLNDLAELAKAAGAAPSPRRAPPPAHRSRSGGWRTGRMWKPPTRRRNNWPTTSSVRRAGWRNRRPRWRWTPARCRVR